MSKDTYLSVSSYVDGEKPEGHTVSIPVTIGPDTLPQELEICLRVAADGTFVSDKDLPAVELMVYMICEKLAVYYQAYPEEAKTAGKRMMEILEATETDDDTFPRFQIENIQQIVNSASGATRVRYFSHTLPEI